MVQYTVNDRYLSQFQGTPEEHIMTFARFSSCLGHSRITVDPHMLQSRKFWLHNYYNDGLPSQLCQHALINHDCLVPVI